MGAVHAGVKSSKPYPVQTKIATFVGDASVSSEALTEKEEFLSLFCRWALEKLLPDTQIEVQVMYLRLNCNSGSQ